ncbi:hypothetical protein FT663_01813 [Candidozyma haemuli var. vulneris]|uniref:Uncharacterized protein n=1 Tax=Candidozyma haemuli TaxID=45357 RepID=A0A2V1B1I7_9ASCO|nr:hypothetical protein CXQ85_002848 [[Candida] haemuloni]KAF3991065.1 hypothetical protein FT662_01893 [[Candida] haemuloni var. vulneris]KAF3993645.1 hypothetical protein FT663_01813 [[Candida] haemuloni var. vulneris]PVH23121.1 hypothetical protein CXQ85_002848 [[Candida] haemuloni]
MRSLIKGHRRSDSSTSDSQNGHPDYQSKAYYRYNKTPQASPKVGSSASNVPHMTPPQHHGYSGSQSTLSSPKKLLTPIKKMFGHHSHSSKHNAPTSGDVLHSALVSDGPPSSKHVPTLHSPRSMSNLNELSPRQNVGHPGSSRPGLHGSHARHSSTSYLESQARIGAVNLNNGQVPHYSGFGLGKPFESSSSVDSAPGQERNKMPIIADTSLAPVNDSISGNHGDSDSNISIAKSINFSAKQASSQENLADGSSKVATDDFYDDDDDESSDDDSDNSSQFSFVKDIRGGRNTSVKYYKTKSSSSRKLPDGVQSNTFDVDDFGYEEEGLSDYDFENNGLDEEEDCEEFENKYIDFDGPYPEDEGHPEKYEDMLDENDMRRALSPPPVFPSQPLSANSTNSLTDEPELDDKRADTSENFITANSSHNFSTPQPEDNSYRDDFLESYMDSTKSPGSDLHITPQQLSLPHLPGVVGSETSSPLINGVTFGNLDAFKDRQGVSESRNVPSIGLSPPKESVERSLGLAIGSSEPDHFEEPRRNSIMDLLGSLEGGEAVTQSKEPAEMEQPVELEQPAQDIRTSIQDIHQLLADLEARPEAHSETRPEAHSEVLSEAVPQEEARPHEETRSQETRRDSIINMMDTLASLANSTEPVPVEQKKDYRKSVAEMMNTLAALDLQNASVENEIPPSTKRSLSARTAHNDHDVSTQSNTYNEENSTESAHVYHLDEDMLFECNQLPEDYDFEQYQNQVASEGLSDFYRSNSYSKKPTKVVQDNSFRSNKIETPQRTVTFYRSNSLGNSENSNSGSLSRNGTVYSATSFTSGEEEHLGDTEKFRQKSLPYALNPNFQLNEKSSDCLSHKSFNLEPITESDSPHLR